MLGRYPTVLSRRGSMRFVLHSSSITCGCGSGSGGGTLGSSFLPGIQPTPIANSTLRWQSASVTVVTVDSESTKESTPQEEHQHQEPQSLTSEGLQQQQQQQDKQQPEQQPEQQQSLPELIETLQRAAAWNHGKAGKRNDESLWEPDFCHDAVQAYDTQLQAALAGKLSPADCELLLSSDTVILALKTLLKSQYDPDQLSKKVREWERILGNLKMTPLTDHLSLRLLTANGKAGNVGRVLQLLQLRKARSFRPRRREFVYAITSIRAASWQQARSRNIYMSDDEQPAIDNPTRWLDAILLNMHDRGYRLTTSLANRMLLCYSATGKTGKAVHHFYRVVRQPVESLPPDERPHDTSAMPKDWFYLDDLGYKFQPIKVKLHYNRGAPPFYKIPSQVRGKLLFSRKDGEIAEKGQFKIEREKEPEYSLPLAAAFAFADSLKYGACGHAGIKLDTWSYNALIKASVLRGALWRAMNVLDEMMPIADCLPNNISYNLILEGLARVGDVNTAQEYYRKMLNTGLTPDAYTVRAIVDGLLNLGDAPGAVTVVQDFFNQHSVLPPYTTHLKILEFCLARDMIYEAKRFVYFIQQLWYWEPNIYHSTEFIKLMKATKRNTQLQKDALKQLFAYFGETLDDSDFI